MATRQEVIFQGLTHSPSDYDCQDGELATCLNLINEDGALKPIHKPVVVEENITLGEGDTIEFVHKVTHDTEIHSHYIIRKADNTWYWMEKDGSSKMNIFKLRGIKVNSVAAIGNIICFVGDSITKYAYWKKDQYICFAREDLQYDITLRYSYKNYNTQVYTETINAPYNKDDGENADYWNIIESYINKTNKSNRFVYYVLGVAAVKLYDGSYINISNVFSIVPIVLDRDISVDTSKMIISKDVSFMYAKIAIRMDIAKELNDIIDGVEIFLSRDESFLKENPLSAEYLSLKEIYDKIDSMTFYHSKLIKVAEMSTPYKTNLNDLIRPLGTEETISLANLYRNDIGGASAIAYNNRLHISNVKQTLSDISPIHPFYNSYEMMAGIITDTKFNDVQMIFETKDYNGEVSYFYKVITDEYGGVDDTLDIYPLPPIISFPMNNAVSATLYLKDPDGYWSKEISLHTSETTGFSFYANLVNGILKPIQHHDRKKENETYTRTENGEWNKISKEQWNTIVEKSKNFVHQPKIEQSLIKVSEAENPLIFPSKNSVQVGKSIIKAIATNTHPISEGQFGEAPLYAFTDEGVWVLMLSEEGTYEARQPANRDICSNPSGILQIDDAVLYPTNRGIMMQQGRNSICITDQLDGYPFNFIDMKYANQIIATNGTESGEISYIRFRDYLKSADMIYDYYDNRIIVFNPNQAYAYVYSLKSKMWGTMKNVFNKRVNIYPESYATNKEGKILNVYVEEPSSNTPYFLCSRPLSISDKETYKTLFTCIARGYFRRAASDKCGLVLYGSNDLFNWFLIKTSVNEYLRGMAGSPYKYFRLAIIGNLNPDESISGLSTEFQERLQNKLR